MIAEWRGPGNEDRAWLMYSANYLLRTGNGDIYYPLVWGRVWFYSQGGSDANGVK